MIFSKNNKLSQKLVPLIALLSISLASCAATPNQNIGADAQSATVPTASKKSTVGAQLCIPKDTRIVMSKKRVGPFEDFYPQKLTTGTLTAAQIICDLGEAHEVKTTSVKTKQHDMPMQAGDRFLRWGENHTNDPIDEISVMVIVGSNGEVSSIVSYDTKEKTILRVSKTEDKINVATGTYTAVRTITYQ